MSTGDIPPRRLTPEEVGQLVPPEPDDDVPMPYLQAAAVLDAFDPFTLRPVSPVDLPHDAVVARLLPVSEQITQGPQRGRWSLSLEARRVALRALGTHEAMDAALEANRGDASSAAQRMFERTVRRQPLELPLLPREDLAALFTVSDWLEGILEGLPAPADVRRALARADLTAPMRRLAGSVFVNRDREMRQLEEFAFTPKTPAPLFLFGPGGVGKSTLLARFILDKVLPAHAALAYIDIDRPTIRPEQPETILLDAAMQLRQQGDVNPTAIDGLMKEISSSLGRVEEGRELESFRPQMSEPLVYQFGQTFQAIPQVVVILDTFEEAQFLGADVVSNLLRQMQTLQDSHGGLRVIIAGRVFPAAFARYLAPFVPTSAGDADIAATLDRVPLPWRPINLSVLDDHSARILLASHLESEHVSALTDDELTDVINIVSRNPMCLKLAGRLLRDEGVAKLRESRSEVLARLKAEKIQALLYGRVLRHLHSEEARTVAYPGLVVRRIDADVVREVLAAPCQLHLDSPRAAQRIVDDLAKEAALVDIDPVDGSLRHRTDVRRAMLQDLTDHVAQDVVDAIDHNAVTFYAALTGAIARAEEIYHRLRLRQAPATLNQRWLAAAAPYLKSAIDEVAPRQQLWLAEKLGATLDADARQTANQQEWEEQTARTVARALQGRSPDTALAVLHERSERSPRSQLYALETEAYHMLNRPDDALRVARAGVDALSRAGAIDQTLPLLLRMVLIEEAHQHFEAAAALLHEAEGVASNVTDAVQQLRVEVTALRLERQQTSGATGRAAEMRAAVERRLTEEMVRSLRGQPVLLRELAAELAEVSPHAAATALETLGAEVGSDAQAEAFLQAATAAAREQPPDAALLKSLERLDRDEADADTIREWATGNLTGRDIRGLANRLRHLSPGSHALQVFQEYFRIGVAATLRDWIDANVIGSVRGKVVNADSLRWTGKEPPAPGGPNLAESALEMAQYGKILKRLEKETKEKGSDVLMAVADAEVSRLQSELARRSAPDRQLKGGGFGVKFGTGIAGGDWLGWVGSLLKYTSRNRAHPMLRPRTFVAEAIPDRARMALVGAFGTGLYGAPKIAQRILEAAPFDLLVHLGGIYYSGTEQEVKERFLDLWPRPAGRRSIALNGNHEMYSGGFGYFRLALPAFGQPESYIAFENSHWLLIGLDTAYVDADVDLEQVMWVAEVIEQSRQANGGVLKKLVFFSCHPPFSRFERQNVKLQQALQAYQVTAWYWAWEHQCIFYDRHPELGVLGRCLGNGGLPEQRKREVVQAATVQQAAGGVSWKRLPATADSPSCRVLDGPNPDVPGSEDKYVPHGFATLELDGPALIERVYLADGTLVLENSVA